MPRESRPRGNSGMASLIRGYDWSQTPLGPVKTWSPGLKNSVDIMLGAGSPISILWTSEYILLYNDAWKKLLGKRHPDALGKPASEIFPHWKILRKKCEKVLSGRGPAESNDLLIENRWFNLSFNPIPRQDGSIGGIFNIASESSKKAHEAFRESEKKFKTLFDSIDEGFCIIQMIFDKENKPVDYRFLEVNSAFEEQTGLVRAEGKKMRDLAPEHEEHWFEIYGKVALTGKPVRFQNQAEQLGRWYDVYAFPYGRPEEQKVGILFKDITEHKLKDQAHAAAVGHDITHRKQAERKLDRQKELLEGIIDNIPVSLVIWDGKLQEFKFNKEFRRLTGWKEADAGSGDFLSKVYPDPEYRRKVKEYMQSRKSEWKDIKTTAKDGRELDISWANVHLSGDRSIGIGIDIRQRKNFEERILWQNRVLNGINRIFQETLTARTDEELGVTCLDAATEVTRSEIGFIGEIGRDGMFHDIAVNNPGWELCSMYDKRGHRKPSRDFIIAGLFGKVLKDGKSLIANNPSSHSDSTGVPKGHPPLHSFLGVPLRINGNTTGMIGVANREGGYRKEDRDALEIICLAVEESLHRKRMEEEIREYRRELEIRVRERTAELAQANRNLKEEIIRREKAEEQLVQAQKLESMGTMTGGIAHDFNNILGAIVLNSELSLFDLPKDSSIRNNIDSILQAALRGKNLVRQMLLFSRKSEKKEKVFSLTPLIEETFKMLRASIPSTIEMDCRLDAGSDMVNADPGQIQQVLMNLCTNAAYAMRGMKGTLDIFLNNRILDAKNLPKADMQPGDYVVLSVRDSGPGMEAEVKNRIFEPFFTTKPVGEGTGLGLSVAYGIIKNHNGHIQVESRPGKGTLFKIYLPESDREAAEQEEECSESLPGGKEHILFIDDEESIVSSVKNMLQHLGYSVTAVTKSSRALRVFSKDPSRFDLEVTDQTMPEMTGEELGEKMMRLRADTPVVICSGYSDMISPEKIMAQGFRGYIMKPFTLKEGAELIRRILDERK